VLLLKRKSDGKYILPGTFMVGLDVLPASISNLFTAAVDRLSFADPSEKPQLQAMVSKTLKKSSVIFKGFMNDPRNTDNAWIESIVTHYHDASQGGVAFRWVEFVSTAQDPVEYEWVGVSEAIPLIAIHLEYLKKVAAALKADFSSDPPPKAQRAPFHMTTSSFPRMSPKSQ